MDGHLGVHLMTKLKTLYLQGGKWLKDTNLGKLTHNLKNLKLNVTEHPHLKEGLFQCIAQLKGLQKLMLFPDQFTRREKGLFFYR